MLDRLVRFVEIAQRWDVQYAAMPEAQFEATIATARETASAVTTTMMLRVSEESKKKRRAAR